jgi:phosphoglycolate phosphatase-like HAD superfamily hydrolase
MKLVVFDLDGTLARTNAVDEECFVQAFSDSLGIYPLNTNWPEYEHITDSGVIREAYANSFGRDPNPIEISNFVECFLALLNERHRTNADLFAEIPGASSLLAALRRHAQWRVAIATGSWERSARFKIKTSGIGADSDPAAFAEDGPSREAIVRTAVARASVRYRQSQFERIVSVGDAIWDIWTAKQLQLPFVGIAGNERAEVLRQLGASHVMEDFASYNDCLQCLEEARIPAG